MTLSPPVKKGIIALQETGATSLFFQLLQDLINHLSLSADDERLAIDYNKQNRGISVNLNSRIILGLWMEKSTPVFLFMIPKEKESEWKNISNKFSAAFQNSGPKAKVATLAYNKISNGFDDQLKKQWLQICKDYLSFGTKSPLRKFHIRELFTVAQDHLLLDNLLQASPEKFLIVNITWNSSNWHIPSNDKSLHGWVSKGNIPHESWNFDFENPRNQENKIFGFAQFTNPPKVQGSNNLIIFYSNSQIVGFYGKAEVLPKAVKVNAKESYNLIGDKDLSLVLKNKIEKVKEKGFLEDKQRVGQIGFSYLEKQSTVLKILKEAIKLNPGDSEKLNALIDWVKNGETKTEKMSTPLKMVQPLNQILYGPPGTGKTYNTIERSIKIANPKFDLNNKTRKEIKDEYERLQKDGLIEFITFHQSMTYEDFIEGIKPVEPKPGETYLKYEVKPGILKRLVAKALFKPSRESRGFSVSEDEYQKATFYKISLGNTANSDDDQIYQFCIENNYIALGWGGAFDFTDKSEEEIQAMVPAQLEKFAAQEVNIFIHYLKKGDYVVVTYGNLSFRAIGIVTDDYEYKKVPSIGVNQFRKVKWLLKDQNIPVEELYYKQFQQQTLYKLNKGEIRKEFFVKANTEIEQAANSKRNHVLIIDEINRGNISQIFGELITLIEDDKRKGKEEELEVILPYSGDRFSVPDNIYIIGTMNTADRSVEALDTALRRRFSFIEMQANPEHEEIKTEVSINGANFNFREVLSTINKRLEKLIGRDHQIGHSYFISKKTLTWDKYLSAFSNKIIPLLQEYFYGDYSKMCLVVGKGFVDIDIEKSDETDTMFFATTAHEALDGFMEKKVWTLQKIDTEEEFANALNLLLNKG